MATMRPYLRRVEVGWIGFWLAGALCGVLLMVGIGALHHTKQDTTATVALAQAPVAAIAPIGGRLGGIASSDTAADWYLRREFNPVATTLTAPAREGTLGQRDIAAPTGASSRIVGPSEGLNIPPAVSFDHAVPPLFDPQFAGPQ